VSTITAFLRAVTAALRFDRVVVGIRLKSFSSSSSSSSFSLSSSSSSAKKKK